MKSKNKKIGRFDIKIIKNNDIMYDAFDIVINMLYQIINEVDSNVSQLFSIEYNDDKSIRRINIVNNDLFMSIFGQYIEHIKKCNDYVYILYTKKITKHIINTLVDDVNSLIKDIMYKNGGNIFPMFPECIGYVYKEYSLLPLCKPREYLVINENVLINYLKNKINE